MQKIILKVLSPFFFLYRAYSLTSMKIEGILFKLICIGINPQAMKNKTIQLDEFHTVNYFPAQKGDKHSYTEILPTKEYLNYIKQSQRINPWIVIERIINVVPDMHLHLDRLINKINLRSKQVIKK